MRTITPSFDGLRTFNVPPPTLEKRFGVAGRSYFIVLDYVQKFLNGETKWLDDHRIPFKDEITATYREQLFRYSLSYNAKAGFHFGWVKGGLIARRYAYTCDGYPFHWHNQVQLKDGSFITLNVIRSLFNQHFDKMVKDAFDYPAVFYEVLRLLDRKSGPVRDGINHMAAARANAGKRPGEGFDFSTQSGSNVGQIIDPCLMIAEGVFTREYEPSSYRLDDYPRYYAPGKNTEPYDEKHVIVMPGPTKGQIVQVTTPLYVMCGKDIYAYIVAAMFEKNNLVLHGVMPMQLYWDLTAKTRVLMKFDPNRDPAWFRIMPIGSPHWISMQSFMSGMNGFDEAVASELLIVSK